MRVGIVGSREASWTALAAVRDYVVDLPADAVVVSGGARGIDIRAEETASNMGLRVISFRPLNTGVGQMPWAISRWLIDPGEDLAFRDQATILPERYGSFAAAAHVRNSYIVELSDKLVAFWDGHTAGTRSTVRRAEAAGLPVEVKHIQLQGRPR